MRVNQAYLTRSRSGEARTELGSDDDEVSKSEEEMVESIVEGMRRSGGGGRRDSLNLDLSGLTKSERELDAERRVREREDLAARLAEQLEESGAVDAAAGQESVSKGETPDPVESCERALNLLDELIARTE